MGLFDDVPDPAPTPKRVRPRSDPVDTGAAGFGPLERIKSLLLTIWYMITGKFNL